MLYFRWLEIGFLVHFLAGENSPAMCNIEMIRTFVRALLDGRSFFIPGLALYLLYSSNRRELGFFG